MQEFHGEYQWGMTVDVDKCTGCKACVTACRAENNIAVVGAEQAAMGRLMDWLRIERIHHGHFPHVHVDFIPMLCQQCGAAPCESVCPVFAAVHTHDGLNGQIYNRCIGTRVCANNCPYHVRMFNFTYPKWPEPMEKILNPHVSQRKEGIMEKCTFCVQRIRRGTIDAKVEKREVHDGEVRPACVQACASEALVFGLLSDPESSVTKYLEQNRHRSVLVHNEHDTRPNVIYLRPQRDPLVLEPVAPLGDVQRGGNSSSHSPESGSHAEPKPETSPSPTATPESAAATTSSTPAPTPAATATPVATATPGAQ